MNHNNKENILLLSCCAPCSCAVIEELAREQKQFTVLFYNPNIKPISEYKRRLEENIRVCKHYNVPLIELEYNNDYWQAAIQGLEDEPERGKRCTICFYIRLKRAMEYAKEHNFTAVASVLGVSRYKNLEQVNFAAQQASEDTGISYVHIEGRKNGLQELRNLIIKEMNLYHQNYCGCKPTGEAAK